MTILDSFMNAMAAHPAIVIGAITGSVLFASVAALLCCEPRAGEDDRAL